ncbi:MAG: hypothetical protein K1X86_15630 [Ignavibacteria bacterium]|nr:hypothetical protein [Ignavibacteria bacterium]
MGNIIELESVNVKFDKSRGVFLVEISTTNGWGEGANVYKLFEDMNLPQGIRNEVLEILESSQVNI